MNKLLLSVFALSVAALSYSQQNILVFKKGNNVVQRFQAGSTISFQLEYKQWQKGEITLIRNDSFYIRPRVIHYNMMGADTTYFPVVGYSVTDIYAMPKRGVLIDYVNGQFQISRTGGHLHWYWVKSGWLFRTGAIGYAGIHTANGLIQNNFSLRKSKTELGIAAGVFAGGVLLKKLYKLSIKTGKRYQVKMLPV
jgi:hypothetical protein